MNAVVAQDLFAPIAAEDWLSRRLAELGRPVGPGTDPLRERVRMVITSAHLALVIAGRPPSGKGVETLSEAFERIFNEPLVPAAPRKTRSPKSSRGDSV